jgi:membrane protease YdiL (CAAX protease family)
MGADSFGPAEEAGRLNDGPAAPVKNPPVPTREILIGLSLPFLIIVVSGLVRTFYLPMRPWSQGYVTFFMLIVFDLLLLFYALAVCRKRGLSPLFKPATPEQRISMLFASLVVAIGINFMIGFSHLLLEKLFSRKLALPDYAALASAGPNSLLSLLLILAGFTAVPVLEEIYFRGFLYNALKTRHSIFFASALQAIVFAAAHGAGLIVGVLYFLAGIVLAAVYELKKDLTFPVLVHGFINSISLIPLLIMILQNFHLPAATWEAAAVAPPWLESSPPGWIEKKGDGTGQRQYAIERWGSQGSKEWKKEANAFKAVCAWFPEERAACAKAGTGVVAIYLYNLKDYRRAVLEADHLIAQFPDQAAEKETALSYRGDAYLMLHDLERSRSSYEAALRSPGADARPHPEAEKGMKLLDEIAGRAGAR